MSTTVGMWPKRFGRLIVPGVALMALAVSACTDSLETPTSIEPSLEVVSTQDPLVPTSGFAGPASAKISVLSGGDGIASVKGVPPGAMATTAAVVAPPFLGVQVDLPESVLLDAGYVRCYFAPFSHATTEAVIFNACGFDASDVDGVSLVFAGFPTWNTSILYRAAGVPASLFVNPTDTDTPTTATRLINGAYWYYVPAHSIGFSALDNVRAHECDTAAGDLKMCLHLVGFTGGYRVGNHFGLNNNSVWYKAVYILREASDETPPNIVPDIDGTEGDNGWFVSDVTVSWTVEDLDSDVTSSSGCEASTQSTDTGGQDFTCSATSAGGTNSVTVTVKRDATAPTITSSRSAPPNANDWYNTAVTVSYTASDAGSGIDAVASDYGADVLSSDGAGQSAAGTVVDLAGNSASATESPINIDQTAPAVSILVPGADEAVQDGVTLTSAADDATSGIFDVRFAVRDGSGTPVGFEDLVASPGAGSGEWEYPFDSSQLPDGYFVLLAQASDEAGNETWTEARRFSIRNWAVLELLPDSKQYRAGRTMPLKFSLRVSTPEDPAQPFVRSEELTVRVFETDQPDDVLQESVLGDGARDYRIDADGELYITNFKTSKQPTDYTVEIWRGELLIGSFSFATTRK